uniref:Protein S100-A1-like n=2 Tax=Sparus aurata TaxID=8175 RepID=A0A671W834_SPAAU
MAFSTLFALSLSLPLCAWVSLPLPLPSIFLGVAWLHYKYYNKLLGEPLHSSQITTKPQLLPLYVLHLLSAAMSELEVCMEKLILLFHKYADEDGDKKHLSKKEFKKLVETELPTFLKTQKNPKAVECIMKDLDTNKDDKLSFEEFLPLVAGLSMACDKCYNLQQKHCKK